MIVDKELDIATKVDFISETNITEALINPVFTQVIFGSITYKSNRCIARLERS